MSGTSADGVDAVAAEVDLVAGAIRGRILDARFTAYSPGLRERVLNPGGAAEIARLDAELGEAFGAAAAAVASGVELVGSHGQTVSHQPANGASLQLGNPAVIAARTCLPVVAGFRAADLAAGGEGAPLVPFCDWHLLSHPAEHRVCLNLGGIANVTLLPAAGRLEDVRAWDVGPANLLIDAAGGDPGGDLGLQGEVDPGLLGELLAHPYFQRPPPKSCGREDFGAAHLESARRRGLGAAALMATLAALTGESVARSLAGIPVDRVLVSGGGVHNRALMRALGERLPGVQPVESVGGSSDFKEALCFAILAFAFQHRIPAGLPNVTGARHAAILGSLTPAGRA